MIRILHFADAHIDVAAHGKHDISGLPVRMLDFLKALDAIIDCAVNEKVDLVIFAGDAYKDRSPSPTYQREWGRRMMRLSQAGIPTVLIVGNHDLSPAAGRAHALQEYATLHVPHIQVISEPKLLVPDDLGGLPLQIMALPWVSRAGLTTTLQNEAVAEDEVIHQIEDALEKLVNGWLKKVDPKLPVVLAAHAAINGAIYGSERAVTLGKEIVLGAALVRDPRIDYVALGHIHKAQDLNKPTPDSPQGQPPIVYPGSIERVDFGEAGDEKYFVIASVEKGNTQVDWRRLDGRQYIDLFVSVKLGDPIQDMLLAKLAQPSSVKDAMVRLVAEYPREMEPFIDRTELLAAAKNAFEFQFKPRPQADPTRILIPEGKTLSQMSPIDLVDAYLKSIAEPEAERKFLIDLAREVIDASSMGAGSVSNGQA